MTAPSGVRAPGSTLSRRVLRPLGGIRPRHPAQVVAVAFALAVLFVTALLMTPLATLGEQRATFRQALFTATSAVCVTGLIVVDTPTYWSTFGQVVIVAGIAVGGFGIMTLASLLGLLVSRRLGLRTRLVAAAETKSVGLGDVARVIRGVLTTSLLIEAVTALVLTLRFWLHYHEGLRHAAYLGVFHAVSAFNNAGFALYSDNMIGFATDPVVCLALVAAMTLGGIGFPVLFELRRQLRRPHTWSLHTKLTLLGSALLVLTGTCLVTAFEWTNPRTLGPLSFWGKLLVGVFQGTMPRTAGFNSLDYGAVNEETLLATDALMFIGGGPASTAGGIKVTTFFLLLFAILAEVRGNENVNVFDRRVPPGALRQALSVALLGVAFVVVSTFVLLAVSGLELDRVLFEVVSAFATVGLSTGITATLPPAGQYVLVLLMFAGRVGPITLASALALRQRRQLYRLPEGRPIIG